MMHLLLKFLLVHILTGFGENALGSEIINGRTTNDKSMLYMASVQRNGHHICGGFLVSKQFVVTAAHCYTPDPLTVVLGTTNLKMVDDDTMRYSVKECKHPFFKKLSLGYDIMLLKLSRKANLSKTESIKPIPLPRYQIKVELLKNCTVAGWGNTRTNGEIVDELRVVDVPIINLNECQKLWGFLPDNVICAGGYDTNKGFCQGDSGGPLVCKGKAVGIVSFNNGRICDYPNIPNIYTDISKYLPWIKDMIKKKKC